jgi:hypothetical protein
MVDATFDGVNLIITLPPTETEVDVEQDLYSAWKRFLLADPENRRFPPAFRAISGDPLTPGLEAAPYFFLRNDLGWRIRPSEENITVLLTGSLVPQDTTLGPSGVIIPTIGAFTTSVLGLQPVTQGVDELITSIDLIEAITAGDVVVAVDKLSFTVAKGGGPTLATYTVSADGLTRTKD